MHWKRARAQWGVHMMRSRTKHRRAEIPMHVHRLKGDSPSSPCKNGTAAIPHDRSDRDPVPWDLLPTCRTRVERTRRDMSLMARMVHVPAVSRLAMCACLAVSVFPGRLIHLPRLASRVTLAVRANARDVIYLPIYLEMSIPIYAHHR